MTDFDQGQPHVDLAGYVLDQLTIDERHRFEHHLAGCVECRRELEAQRAAATLLGAAAEPVAVPDGLEARVFAAIAAEPPRAGARATPVITLSAPRTWLSRLRAPRALGLVTAAAAVAVVGGLGAAHLATSGGPTPYATIALVAAQPGSPANGIARLDRTDTGTTVELTVHGLESPPAGHFYTCWLVADDDTMQHQDRVSVGTFTVSGTGSATLRWDTAANLARYPHLGVTLEPDTGNPLHQGPKVLVATG